MAESKSPEEDAVVVLQKEVSTIKCKPEDWEKNKKSGSEGKGRRIWCSRVGKKGSYVSFFLRFGLRGPVQPGDLFDDNAVADIRWSLTTIRLP